MASMYKQCKEEGCVTKGTNQGYCYTHWAAWLFPDDEAIIEETLHMCANKGCTNAPRRRGEGEELAPALCGLCLTTLGKGRPFPARTGDYLECAECGIMVDHEHMPSGTDYCPACRAERARLAQNKDSRNYRARKKAAAA